MINEEWRPVIGYEGLYEVSNLGRVKSLGREKTTHSKRWGVVFTQQVKEKILVPLLGSNGRYHFSLYKDGKKKIHSRASIVANAWVGGYQDGYEINHIDENVKNDVASNLEWCSHLYNMRYGTRNDRAIKKMRKTKGRRVKVTTKQGGLIGIYETISDACRDIGCSSSNVSKCCLGKIPSLAGYYWQYID